MTTSKTHCIRTALFTMIVFLFIVCAAARLNAQGYAKIVGTVTDPTGAVIPSATVTATQTQTGAVSTVNSGGDGAFVFPALPPSNYSISVSAGGFQNFKQTGIVLQANQSVTVNIKMAIGSSAETVSVSADAQQVDTTSGTLSQVIDEARVVDLPLNGRNAATLITLVAGVVDATNQGNGVNQGNGKTFPAAVVTSVNGTLPSQSNYLLDGGNNVDEMTNVNGPFPFPDALQEFSVQTSNYNAEFGQSAGAVVNIVTKSGGNRFHGDAFEFLRNGYFNAKPFFATKADTLKRHQYGATIGGPVIIPHFSKGLSTQFFFGYQHTQLHQSSNASTTTVPTLAEEGRGSAPYADYGNLCASPNSFNGSGLCVNASGTAVATQQITNPFTNTPYANNRIPSSDFDPASVAYEKVFPTFSGAEAPGKIGGTVNYSQPTVQFFNEYVARVDHAFGEMDHLFGRYFSNYYEQAAVYDPAMLSSYRSYFNTRYQNALLSETHTFTNNLLNSLILSYQREVALRGGPAGSPDITAFGVKNLWQPTVGPYLSASITGYFGATSSAFAGWGRNNYTFNDDLHWVKGSHNLAFGGHYELSKFDVTNVFQSYGGFLFGSATNTIGNVTYQYPNAMANFQLGFTTAFGQGNFELLNDRAHFPGVYAQDSWKINHRLTLNYGVRWEQFAPWVNRIGQQTAFSATAYAAGQHSNSFGSLPAGMLLSGDPGIAKNGLKNKNAQFMPRLGFAYDMFGDGKTVVRGGTGIFYQDRMPGFFNLNQAGNVPNTVSVGLSNLGMFGAAPGANPGGPFSNPYCTGCAAGAYANPFPFTLPFASSHVFPNGILVDEFDPTGNFQVPVTYNYNLTIERQLASSWAVRLAYVGSGSRHQFVNLELNPTVNNGSGLGVNSRRVYNTSPTVGPCTVSAGCSANYAQIVQAAMIGSARFNSFQTTLEKKISHGLSLLANYTFSKTLDDMPQATRVSNTANLNAGASYVYPLYPAGATGIPAAASVTDIKALDRGRSDIDHPTAISISYVCDLPRLRSGYRALNYAANGWRTSGLVQHRSGDSLTAYMGSDNSLTGLSQDRAQQNFAKPAYTSQSGGTGYCPAGKNCVAYLNPAAFSVPAQTGPGTGFGNVVKGSLRGPAQTNWNGAVVRTFPVYRETNMEFRAEYFNLLNHALLCNPAVNNPISSSTTFGTIQGCTGDTNRIAQFALKYTF
jgi:hypothetical protein